jgi:hypothetical protein
LVETALHGAAPSMDKGGSATGDLITDVSHGRSGDLNSLRFPTLESESEILV